MDTTVELPKATVVGVVFPPTRAIYQVDGRHGFWIAVEGDAPLKAQSKTGKVLSLTGFET